MPVAVVLACVLVTGSSQAQIKLSGGTTVLFATIDEAKKILVSRDDFVRRMSPFDRAARMKTDKVQRSPGRVVRNHKAPG